MSNRAIDFIGPTFTVDPPSSEFRQGFGIITVRATVETQKLATSSTDQQPSSGKASGDGFHSNSSSVELLAYEVSEWR